MTAAMATETNMRTYSEGPWKGTGVPLIKAADFGMWLRSHVFDGARQVYGLTPELDLHCARICAPARAVMLDPWVGVADMIEIIRRGLAAYSADAAVYIGPMFLGVNCGFAALAPKEARWPTP